MASPKRYRTILLFGMPGSGKGTQGSVLGQLPDFVHISMGDVFRKIPKWGQFGQEIARYTSKGALVPDDLTVRIWERHIQVLEMQELLLPEQHTLILDGIPQLRAGRAARAPPERGPDLSPDDQRYRKGDRAAQGPRLRENRLDDMNDEVIRRRLHTYYEETFRTLSFYTEDLVYDINASQAPIDVLRDIVNRLSELQHTRTMPRPSALQEMAHSGLAGMTLSVSRFVGPAVAGRVIGMADQGRPYTRNEVRQAFTALDPLCRSRGLCDRAARG